MSTTPTKKGRGVFTQLNNLPLVLTPTSKPHLPPPPTSSSNPPFPNPPFPNPPTMKADKPPTGRSPAPRSRPALAADPSKRARTSLKNRRVSFHETTNFSDQPDDDSLLRISSAAQGDASDALPPRPPPSKVARLSRLASPTQPRSPYFAAREGLLGVADEDDSVPLPAAPDLGELELGEESSAANVRSTPVPLRRGSIAARDRQSFGVFLDDEITVAEEGVDGTEAEYSVHEGYMGGAKGERDSDESEGDVTQNLLGFGDLMERDREDASDEDVRVMRDEEDRARRVSTASSRRSLSYVMKENEGGGGEADTSRERERERMRWSMMPINEGNRADVDAEEGSDEDLTIQIGHRLLDLEEEDEMDRSGNEEEDAKQMPDEIEPQRDEGSEEGAAQSEQKKNSMHAIPPQCRTLFLENGEDSTLHYHDNVNIQVENLPGVSILKQSTQADDETSNKALHQDDRIASTQNGTQATGFSAPDRKIICTPRSATGSKLRAMGVVPVSTSHREQEKQLQELSNSVLRRSQSERGPRNERGVPSAVRGQKDTTAISAPAGPPFDLDAFLGTHNIHFDDKVHIDHREFSLAPAESNFADIDRNSVEWKVLEGAKKADMLQRLEEEVEKQLGLIEDAKESIQNVEEDIRSDLPPILSLLSNTEPLPQRELADYRVSLKRLRKVSTLQVRLDWIEARQEWEKAIQGDLAATVHDLENDISELESSNHDLDELASKLASIINSSGIDHHSGNDEDVALVEVKRQEVKHEYAHVKELKEFASSKRSSERRLVEQRNALIPERAMLMETRKDLITFANAKTNKNLKDLMAERSELNMIACGITGLVPLSISPQEISLVVSELMQTTIRLDGKQVQSVSVKEIVPSRPVSEAVSGYVTGAVNLASAHLKQLLAVRDIPFALHTCSKNLFRAKKTLLEATGYLDENLGEITKGGIREDNPAVLDLSLIASFYSLKQRVKFDVSFTISTNFAESQSLFATQEVRDVDITRFIGTTPTEDELISALEGATFKQSPTIRSIPESLSAIWSML